MLNRQRRLGRRFRGRGSRQSHNELALAFLGNGVRSILKAEKAAKHWEISGKSLEFISRFTEKKLGRRQISGNRRFFNRNDWFQDLAKKVWKGHSVTKLKKNSRRLFRQSLTRRCSAEKIGHENPAVSATRSSSHTRPYQAFSTGQQPA